jgi:hypothetical protein
MCGRSIGSSRFCISSKRHPLSPSHGIGEPGARAWPRRFTIHVSLRPSLHIHGQSFGRFDEITYLVEKTAGLTLPDLGLCDFEKKVPSFCGKR